MNIDFDEIFTNLYDINNMHKINTALAFHAVIAAEYPEYKDAFHDWLKDNPEVLKQVQARATCV